MVNIGTCFGFGLVDYVWGVLWLCKVYYLVIFGLCFCLFDVWVLEFVACGLDWFLVAFGCLDLGLVFSCLGAFDFNLLSC